MDHRPLRLRIHTPQIHFVQIDHAQFLGLGDEEGVEVRAVPMRVRDVIIRRRGDEQVNEMLVVVTEGSTGLVMKEREDAF